jgi:glycosyltransferase involved in cell wall biosynthesis
MMMTGNNRSRFALVGSYVPRRCGIATFSNDLANAIARQLGDKEASDGNTVAIVALNDREEGYDYPHEVAIQIHQQRRDDYRNAAEILNTSWVEAVSIQHEYGLFGGECGSTLFEMVDRLHKPVVPTLHTVLAEPSNAQRDVLRRLGEKSSFVIVMAERARMLLQEVYGVPTERIRLIPHGVPDLPFGEHEAFKERFGLAGRPLILTFGLLGPGKSIETALDALAVVVKKHPEVVYIVLGVTHPGIVRESGEMYRMSLERKVVELGLRDNVVFHNRYVSHEDLGEYLRAADFYVTPYRNKDQITSGTLAYAVAAGCAVLSTPYWHAQELLAEDRGRLFDFGDAPGLAQHMLDLLEHPEDCQAMRRRCWEYGRSMVWSSVADQYIETYEQAWRAFDRKATRPDSVPKLRTRMSIPEIRLAHLFRMTDDTGTLQHAVYATPDRRHGYCTDDNARGLIVSAMAWAQVQSERALSLLHVFLSFLHSAKQPAGSRFRNFMSFDRRWLETDGSDDCQGRVVWALGYLIAHPPDDSSKLLATDLLRNSIPLIPTLRSPRSWALSILGLYYYCRTAPDDGDMRQQLTFLADRLESLFQRHASNDWPWFEDVVTYDNGRIPQALLLAGLASDRRDLIDRGLNTLQWLLDIQRGPTGNLSIIGTEGWYRRGAEKASYDQQPIEPAALIGACKAAYRATNDERWLAEMRRCFEWYLGHNDGGHVLIDFKSRGCRDGLKPNGVNQNQGAESLLSWLLSLLIMVEMQSGDKP